MTDRRNSEFRVLFRLLRIEDQRRFYEARRDEYGRAHQQTVTVRNGLLVLAGVCGIIGQILDDAGRAGSGVASAVLAGLAAAVTGFETLIGFSRLEKLYADAALNLREAALDWDALDPQADLTAEVRRVEDVFRTENGQWGQLVVESAPDAPGPTANHPAATPPA